MYLIAKTLNVHPITLLYCFLPLHLIFVGVVTRHIKNELTTVTDKRFFIFWFLLLLLFILPGAYLEYPSDSWEHFRRIFKWDAIDSFEQAPLDIANKFSYFWNWSWCFWVPLEFRRIALNLISSFWQFLLAIQIFKLARALKLPPDWSCLQALGFFLLIGTSTFSFRYYALSSTIVAYIFYLQALIILLQLTKEKLKTAIVPLAALSALIWFNHQQELLFLSISALALCALKVIRIFWPTNKHFVTATISVIAISGLAFGKYFQQKLPELTAHISTEALTSFGNFAVWKYDLGYYIDVIGVHGLIAYLVVVVVLAKRIPQITALTIAPLVTLLFPPTALLLAYLFNDSYLTSRLFLAFPLSISLIFGLKALTEKLASHVPSLQKGIVQVALAGLVVIIFSFPKDRPWRGRLQFQIYNTSPEQELVALDQTALWFAQNRSLTKLRQCLLLTDQITKMALWAQLGLSDDYNYWTRSHKFAEVNQLPQSFEELISQTKLQPVCGILIANNPVERNFKPSSFGNSSGHWKPHWQSFDFYLTDNFVNATKNLTTEGWTTIDVPPFYTLYEPPAD